MLEVQQRKALSVLIVEDNLPDVYILKSLLEEDHDKIYSFTHCQTKKQAIEALYNQSFDVVLLDLGIPDSIEFETLDYLTEHYAHLPVIILTGYNDKDKGISAIQRGAQDYLIKDSANTTTTVKAIEFAISRKLSSNKLYEKDEIIKNLMSNVNGVAFECTVGKKVVFYKLEHGDVAFMQSLKVTNNLSKIKHIIPPEKRKEVYYKILEGCHSGFINVELPIKAGSDDKFVLMQGKSSIISGEGEDLKFAVKGIIIDITERTQRKIELKKQRNKALSLHSQLKSAQLNPHFLFNALASIQHFIVEEDNRTALDITSDFALMVREVLDNSTHTYITLEKEIQFLKRYISLESKRLQKAFELNFTHSDNLDPEDVNIPPMLIQPLVENALIHGLSGVEGKACLAIDFSFQDDNIICTITDNGLGFKYSKTQTIENKNTRYGASQILAERLEGLEKLTKKSFNLNIDSSEDGTLVELSIPADLY